MIAFDKQYTLKQNIYYFLATKLNLIIFACSYLFSDDIISFFLTYPFYALFAYRFLYNETKLDNPYRTFLYERFISLTRKIRSLQ